jgi:hypothetical protein
MRTLVMRGSLGLICALKGYRPFHSWRSMTVSSISRRAERLPHAINYVRRRQLDVGNVIPP